MILLHVIYYLASHGTQALPIRDIDNSAQSCHDPSHDRTIWDTIWSCVVTIFSCTWLAIHPNIPGEEEGKGWRFLRRVGMFVSAVMVPELMIFWAMKQWMAARELKKKYKNFKWTLTHGFFAVMGGFMLYEDDTPQYTLDPWELGPYLVSGQIKITEGEIRDRSKGDILTKGLVVLQTTWFVIQLIARGAEGLPITELEIVTLAFASLNFITYAVWWDKPLNVEFPVCVYNRHSVGDATEDSSGEGEIEDGTVNPESLNFVGNNTSGKEISEGGDKNENTDQKKRPSRSFKFNILFDVLDNIRDAFRPHADNLPSKIWHKYPLIFLFMLMAAPGDDLKLKRGAKRVPTFYSGRIDDIREDASIKILFIALAPVTVLFGGIHCIAWTFHFPTHAEQLIWRVSSIFITSAPMATLVVLFVVNFIQLLFGLSDSIELFFMVPSAITWIFYPLARVILLVQALMTLRSLPPDAYSTVQWTTFIPHI